MDTGLASVGQVQRLTYSPREKVLSLVFGKGLSVPIPRVSEEHWEALQLQHTSPQIIAYVDRHLRSERWMKAVAPSGKASTTLSESEISLFGASFDALAPYLGNDSARRYIKEVLLDRTPCLVIPVAMRRSKHGDHRPALGGRLSEITVNVSGNPQQFFITLLHEIAHAEVWHRFGSTAEPHGYEWRLAYQRLLRGALRHQAFPAELVKVIESHASAPPSSSSRDITLQTALRAYDERDKRPMVQDLAEGVWFSPDGKLALLRGKLLRSRIECLDRQGQRWRISPAARVHTIYRPTEK